ncbi:MAG: NFACT family protein, partial [Eubacteriales bacterium]|nr:NFACT family protein [Eubacteriales bacterium]
RSLSRVRCVLPSLAYETPISTKLNPLAISRPTLVEMLGKRKNQKIKAYLSEFLQGVSSQTAEEILYRYMPQGYAAQPREPEKLGEVILSFFSGLGDLEPAMYLQKDGMPFFYSPVRYGSIGADAVIIYKCANEMADSYYMKLKEKEMLEKKRGVLSKRVSKQIEKLSSILKKQLDTIENAKKAEKYKNLGDIITANIYRIKKGMRTLQAEDFSTGEGITIALDTRLSPAANAQKNYKRYNKLKSGLDITAKRMMDNNKEIAFLESVQVSLVSSETMDELCEIEYELGKAGILKTASASVRATEKPSVPHQFVSSDGYTIYAGKNNRQNDTLTMKTAGADDIWLHTKDIPGAHVLISGAKGNVPDITLLEAATIAATLSKARNSLKVPVDYTQRKNVRKPGGAKPGMVVYDGYNTILVSPDKSLFERLIIR